MSDDGMSAMDREYQRDTRAGRAMDDLRRHIDAFVLANYIRCTPRTADALIDASNRLSDDSAHIVRSWA